VASDADRPRSEDDKDTVSAVFSTGLITAIVVGRMYKAPTAASTPIQNMRLFARS
jgi:hypothetical protein